MTEQSPDLRGQAVGPPYARTARGRHAIPRTSALTRLRLPLGRALALTALPTVLVLASQRPPAVDTSATAAHSAPEEEPGGGADCARPDGTAAPATAPTPSAAPSTPSTSSVPTSGEPAKPSEHAADEETGLAPAPTATPSATAATTTGLTGILGSLLRGETEQQSPAPDRSPSPGLAAPTPAPTTTQPSGAPPAAPHASPAPGHRSAEPSSRPAPTAGASRTCDISGLKAPEDTSAGRFAAESWNMKGSRLELRDLVFGGVVTVDTAAGPKRVLKFSAAAVTIRDLKMAVPVGPQIQHIDGAPGSTSTLQGDRITMYVESLTGTLSGVEGIPLPPVLRLHLTPDTVPEWLYGTVGKLDLKLRLGLDDADIDQAGQTGGELVIPGIHGYGTPR